MLSKKCKNLYIYVYIHLKTCGNAFVKHVIICFTFSCSFSFLNTKRVFWVQILPIPLPPTFFHFLNIVQYLFVYCTIPSILGSHPPYPTSPPYPNIAFTSTLTPHRPDPPPTDPLPYRPYCRFFFVNFPQNFNSSFTSTLTPPLTRPPTQPPTQPPRPPNFFYLNFHKNFNSSFTSTLTPPTRPLPPTPSTPPPPQFF